VGEPATFQSDIKALWLRVGMAMRAEDARVLALVGAGTGAGATMLSLALARTAAAEEDGRTLLVDATPGPSGLPATLGIAPTPGTADLLGGEAELPGTIRSNGSRLAVLPGGDSAALERATSPQTWRGLFARLRQHRYERLFVDAGDVSTASAMAAAVGADAVLLVVRAGRCRWQEATAAVDRLRSLGVPLLGVVLNDRGFAIPSSLYRRL
jgi:protein-tyrosine kinase